ncbi:MAG: Ig-like domain-containing protein [bacterium]
MSDWKKRLLSVGAYFGFGVLALVILYTVYQGWTQKLDSKWFSTGGFFLITGLTILFWKKMLLGSRVQLLATYLVVLIGAVALYFTPQAKDSFKLGSLTLSFLVNLLIFLSLSLSLVFILRGIKLSRNLKIAIGVLGGLFSIPFLIGMIKDIPLADLFQGEGFVKFLPWFLQPAFLGVAILLPVLCLFLIVDLFRAARDPNRSTFRSFLSLLCSLVPITIGIMAMKGQAQTGVVARYFGDHSFMSFQKTQTDPGLSLDWSAPPVKTKGDDKFWVEWEGVMRIPKKGKIQFKVEGEGKGFLYLDGKRVFSEDGRSEDVVVEAGSHDFRAGAIEEKGKGKFALMWKREGDETFTPIDPKFLGHADSQVHWRRSPRQAAQVGLDWLQSASMDWQKEHQCFGCHVQGQVLMGMSVAKKNNYAVNEDYYKELYDFVKKVQNEDGTYHSSSNVTATQFAGMGMSYVDDFKSIKDNKTLQKSLDWLVKQQKEDGEVPLDHDEPPIDQGSIMNSANSVIAFDRGFKETGDSRFKQAADKALNWIASAKAETTQDKVFKILALSQYGSSAQKQLVPPLVEQLKKEQRDDGGWAETAAMKGSNAYATGQVLYAFKNAGVSVSSPEFGKGVRFLLDHQKITGDWPAENTQTGRPSEFAPTMWAVIGLAGSFGEIIPEIVEPKDKSSVQGVVPIKAQVINFTESAIQTVAFDLDGAPLPAGVADKTAENVFTTSWNSQGAPTGEHKIHVVATNKEGKKGETTISVYTGIGVKVKITNPAAGSVVTGPQTLVSEAEGLYGQTVQKVEFLVNGAKIGEGSKGEMPNTYSIPWDATSLPDGNYQIQAVATSSMGQQAQDLVQVSKKQALAVKIAAPQSGQTVSGASRCSAEVTNLSNVPISHVEFLLDQKSLGMATAAPYEISCNFSGEPMGPHTLTAVATTVQEQSVKDSIPLVIGEEKGPGYLKVQLQNLDEAGGEQVLYFPPDNIELILDMSGSMWEQIQGKSKIEIAKEVLASLVKGFPKTANLGVRVYGHRSKGDCKDTELLVPFGKVDPDSIIAKVNALKPKGMTPIDYNLRQGLTDVQGLQGSKVIILVTDGIESCKGDPVKAAQDLMAAGLKLKVDVVGFNVANAPDAVAQLKKVAEVGQGKFFSAESAEELQAALAEAVKVTYSVYDAQNRLVFAKPLGLESSELMSGVYRIEVALDPPLILIAKIEKGKTSVINVIKQNKAFRMESSSSVAVPSGGASPDSQPQSQPAGAMSQPASMPTQSPQSMPSTMPASPASLPASLPAVRGGSETAPRPL